MSPGYVRRTVLVVATVLGLSTAALIGVYIHKSRQGAGKPVRTIVASEYIPAQTVVSPRMVEAGEIPISEVTADTAMTIAQVRERVTIAPIEKGKPIALSLLADKSSVFGLAAIIPQGTRAMTISVDATDIIPGFLQPGGRVDVVASFVDGSDTVAKTILQNVPLLAVNERMKAALPPPGNQPEQPAKTPAAAQPTATLVTIAVTPPEAERLVAAQYKGKLKLGLRGLNDNSMVATAGASTGLIVGQAKSSVVVKPVPPPAKPFGRRSRPTLLPPAVPPMDISGLNPMPTAPVGKIVRVIKGTEVQDVAVDR